MDGWSLSSNYKIRQFQIFSLYFVIIITILIIASQFYHIYLSPLYINDNQDKGVNLHGHVNATEAAAAELSKGISTVGANIGLGRTMVGVGTAVGKTIAKSNMPPLQKVGIVLGGSIMGGVAHSIISKNARKDVVSSAIENKDQHNDASPISDLSKDGSKFLDNNDYTPLEGILSDIQTASITCLSLIIILIIQLVYKLHIKDNITLNLSKYLGKNYNKTLESYINKIISLNKKNEHYIYLINSNNTYCRFFSNILRKLRNIRWFG